MIDSKDLLETIFKRNNLLDEYRNQRAIILWNEITKNLNSYAQPKAVKGNTLIVEVPSSSAKQELSYLEGEYLDKINENLTGGEIKKIKFELGNPSQFQPTDHLKKQVNEQIDNIQLDPEEKSEIDGLLNGVELERDLKQAIKQVATTQLKLQKAKLSSGWKKCPFCGCFYLDDNCVICENS